MTVFNKEKVGMYAKILSFKFSISSIVDELGIPIDECTQELSYL